MTATAPTIVPSAPASRPNVLAYPSPTTSRFIVFLAALLAAGAFVGNWMHNEVLGDSWVATAARCEQQSVAAAPSLRGAIDQNAASQRCQAPSERRHAAFSLAGALLAGGCGLLVMLLAPAVLERRRRLRPLPPALNGAAERAEQLARGQGLARAPRIMLGSAALHDAFSYGTPGRYRIALPPAAAVRWHDAALFDPLVEHELAHVSHHDVALAWLAKSVWYALAPLLLVPVVASIVNGDLSLMPDYLWRAALLAVTVQLTSSALLRSREHDADLRAAQAPGGPGSVAGLLEPMSEAKASPRWRRVLAKHPSARERLEVLERPRLAARVTLIDGLTTGFLAGLSIPVIGSTATAFLTGSGHLDRAWLLAAWLAGPLIAGSIGLGLCRAALVGRVDGAVVSPARPALGVAAGLVLGEAASFANTGTFSDSLHPLAWLPLLGLLGGAATVLAASVAELLADASPTVRRARSAWLLSLLVMATLFSAMLWIGRLLQTPLALGWSGVEARLVTELQSWPVLVAFAALGFVAVWWAAATRSAHTAPGWLVERGERPDWLRAGHGELRRALTIGTVAGLAIVLVTVAYRIAASPLATFAAKERYFYSSLWLCGAAALAAALPVALARSPRGAALAAPAALVACLIAVAGWLALNTVYGGSISWVFVRIVAGPPLGFAFAAVVIAAPLMLVPARRAIVTRRAWVAATGIALACAALLIAERATLTPLGGAISASRPPTALAESSAALDAQLYGTRWAPLVRTTFVTAGATAKAIATDPNVAGSDRAEQLMRQVVQPLRDVERLVAGFRASSRAVREANATSAAMLLRAADGYGRLAAALRANDEATLNDALRELAAASDLAARWLRQVSDLNQR